MDSLVLLAEVVGVFANVPAETLAPVLVTVALANVVDELNVDSDIDNDGVTVVSAVNVLEVVVVVVPMATTTGGWGSNSGSSQGKDSGNRVFHICGWD